MLLGQKLGLDPQVLAAVINSSTGACWACSTNNPVPGAVPEKSPPCERDYDGGFATSLMLKVPYINPVYGDLLTLSGLQFSVSSHLPPRHTAPSSWHRTCPTVSISTTLLMTPVRMCVRTSPPCLMGFLVEEFGFGDGLVAGSSCDGRLLVTTPNANYVRAGNIDRSAVTDVLWRPMTY